MYIDAGTGSMILQAAAAGVFTLLVFCRQIVARCKTLFARNVDRNARP